VVLGLWNEDLAGLEKNAAEAETRHRAARAALSQFKKLRDSGALSDPDATWAEYEQKVREHQDASTRWQKAACALTQAVGELGRLDALYKAAEQHRRKVSRQADAAQTRLGGARADLARAEGERDALLLPSRQECTQCGQTLPERAPGQCPQCDQPHPRGDSRRARQVAAVTAKVERLRLRVGELEEVAALAGEVAAAGEQAAAQALTDRDAFDREHLAPARRAAQQAEKEAFGLSRDVAQLKRQTENADYIRAQEEVIKRAKDHMEAAQAARDAAQSAHEVRRKEVTGRLSQLFLARLRQINPAVETAHIDPHDFTTLVKEHHEPGKTFDDSSVAGSPKVVTNVALLLALRDLGRLDAAVRVPPLLIIDSPLAGLGATGLDRGTSLRLIDTLISVADDPSADGYACQVVAATNDPLPRTYPGVREIPINETDRFFDHAPAMAG
jgi:rubrerythrin